MNALSLSPQDRFDRFRRIEWWEQEKLSNARVLVIGAGALGNEILKNLALLGVGNILVADCDVVEISNLSRSALFRERHEGRAKAEVAAEAVRDLHPGGRVESFCGDAVTDLGLGAYRWADVVVAGLDNREARLHVNRCCGKTVTPWIDGATEQLRGIVRVFEPPLGPCFECTMSAADWKAIKERRGCAGMLAEGIPVDRVATTPVTASILGAVQCQEALKLLHGLPSLSGQGWVFDGLTNDAYTASFNRDEECNSHEPWEEIAALKKKVWDLTLGDALREAAARLGEGAVIEFNHEMLTGFDCHSCKTFENVWKPLASVPESRAACPVCGQDRRAATLKSVQESDDFLDRTCRDAGIPPWDIVTARLAFKRIGLEFSGDEPAVLKNLRPSDK